ncbi:hypothetical protein CC80DRAFT_553867 [Byssothecium circinans]|uniref:Uncharacterized protein n=1 Tax=Byssothecium circinans TaxID=147558 RepID=A0A6A5TGQ9_9PLEO|nr:hypothetical protein CC80DRAFT_553867 [Byssothecium circinans]
METGESGKAGEKRAGRARDHASSPLFATGATGATALARRTPDAAHHTTTTTSLHARPITAIACAADSRWQIGHLTDGLIPPAAAGWRLDDIIVHYCREKRGCRDAPRLHSLTPQTSHDPRPPPFGWALVVCNAVLTPTAGPVRRRPGPVSQLTDLQRAYQPASARNIDGGGRPSLAASSRVLVMGMLD